MSVTIERAAYPPTAAIEDVRINHGCGHVAMPQQFLDRADVVAVLQQMGREAVAEHMAGHALGDLGELCRPFHRFLQSALIEVLTSYHARTQVGGALFGRADILPA